LSPIVPSRLAALDRYWRAANYLSVGQIYLQANPLLRQPLAPEHIKPRLLGHWGTSPGLNFIYAHLNRLIQDTDAPVLFLAGPGHGGPAVLANVYLEGTYSEVYPHITEDTEGLTRFFRQFSTPGGVPSHVSVPTPGSIHEGGELGYVLVHAFGAVFDDPDLIAAAVVGDGEAETGPLEGSWKSVTFLNPARDGAVLPILHLNGYKIGGPTVLGRKDDRAIAELLSGHGYDPRFIAGDDPATMHAAFAQALDLAYADIRALQAAARSGRGYGAWPALVLRTPKGWTGPKTVDGVPIEGTFRAHQVPITGVRENPAHLALLEQWMRSYAPEELFDANGRLDRALASLAPRGDRRMGALPQANGGQVLVPLDVPDVSRYAAAVTSPGTEFRPSTRALGALLRDVFVRNAATRNFRLFCPDETASNRLDPVFEVEQRCFGGRVESGDDHVSPQGRVMEVLSEHLCQGWLEGYVLTGRHGLFATYEAFAMVSASLTVQHAKWLEEMITLPWRRPVASLNVLLTSTCWRQDHNGFSHQGPGLIDVVLSKRGTVARVYLPPDANSLLSVADHCLRSRNYVNLIVIDKQPQLQWLDLDAAREHCRRGASVWDWASTDASNPEVVLAAAGDIMTLEIVAAAAFLRRHAPDLRVRVVNVVDLMTLYAPDVHPHGVSDARFVELFTADRPVIFAFHGYQRAIHEIVHGRPHAERFHVRGFNEQGTTTTPFQMVAMNGVSRFHLAEEALRRTRGTSAVIEQCRAELASATAYARTHFEDPPALRDWTWPG